jgi:hypothetical protein
MASGAASITIRGDVKQALAALESLGLKAEETGGKVEGAFGSKIESSVERTGGLFGKLGSIVSGLGLPFSESFTKMGDKMGEAETKGKGFGASMASLGKGLTLGVAAAAVGVGYESIEMADKLETARAKLEAALKGAGSSFDALKPQIDGVDSRMEKLGFTNAQTEGGLAALTVATNNPTKAMQLMGTAADLARFKNIDLATAGTAVAKAMEGNLKPLKQLGIDLPINAASAEKLKVAQENLKIQTEQYQVAVEKLHDKHKVTAADEQALAIQNQKLAFAQRQVTEAQNSGTLVLDALNQRIGGQANEYTKTFAGRMQELKATTEDLGAKLGLVLVPMLEKLGQVTANVIGWFEKHKTVAEALGIALAILVAGPMAAFAAELIVDAAAAVVALAPLYLMIAVAAAVGAAIYELVTHFKAVVSFLHGPWGTAISVAVAVMDPFIGIPMLIIGHWKLILDFLKKAWADIKQWTMDGVNFVIAHWQLLLAGVLAVVLGPFAAIPMLIWRYWNQISGFTVTLWHDITGFFTSMWHDVETKVYSGIVTVVQFFSNLPGLVLSAIGGLLGDMFHFGASLIQNLINGVGSMAGSLSSSIGGAIRGALSDIPGVGSLFARAAGGPVAAGNAYVVGENGPELFLPSASGTIVPNKFVEAAASAPMVGGGGGGGGGGPVSVVLQIDGSQFAAAAWPSLRTFIAQGTSRNSVRVLPGVIN